MTRKLFALGAAGVVLALTAPAVLAAPSPPSTTRPPTSTTLPGDQPINFIGQCAYSHSAPDDPIVHPHMPGTSHLHDFFANRSTDANSTYATMLAAPSTCLRPGEKAGYWVPALYNNGVKVQPIRMSIYYFQGQLANASIKAFPAGLKLVAGSASATTPQGDSVVTWSCDTHGDTTLSPMVAPTPPTCPTGQGLKGHVKFPNCWDGVNLDSPDHKSHMAYASRGACPAGYPVPVPKIQLNIFYPITGDPSGLTLASGNINSLHGDFFNTWVQSELERLVNTCIVPDIHCDARA